MFEEQHEPEFIVYGANDVLQKMVINIETWANDSKYIGYPVTKTQTLLYKGKQSRIQNDNALFYAIYFSYENKVGLLRFDNVESRSEGHINRIDVHKEQDALYLIYYGLNSYIQEKSGIKSKKIDLIENYFKENNIADKAEQEEYRKKFFDFFDPDKQEYQLLPLDKKTSEHYLSLSLEDKKKYNLPADYIKQMNLPDDELKELLDYSNKKSR